MAWSVYLLKSGLRTYIGATTDPDRRLRQHNGDLVGGARATRTGRPWSRVLYITGFQDRRSAYRWEKLLKVRCRRLGGRIIGFHQVSRGECPLGLTRRQKRVYEVPEGLDIWVD